MKKQVIFILAAFLVGLFAATISSAADIYWPNANQFTLSWEEVTTDMDGDPLMGVTYEVLLCNVTSDPDRLSPNIIETAEISASVTLAVKGRYYVGVRSVWDGMNSDINWADNPDYQEVPAFGIRFGAPPAVPRGLSFVK